MLLLHDLLLSAGSVQNKVRDVLQFHQGVLTRKDAVCVLHAQGYTAAVSGGQKMLTCYGMTVEGKRDRVVPYIWGKRAWSELSPELCLGCVPAKSDRRETNQSHAVKLQLNRLNDQSLSPLPLCI